ncbi:MAG TPA: hypothetical protein VNW92_19470 [Polyangiaceae bacterium]|nr:hypothetical protein [Polyangiaceae bacterium]
MGASSKCQPGIWVAWCFGLAVLASSACGGGAAGSGAPPATPRDHAKAEPSEESAEDDSPAEEDSAPPRSACADGTCSPCGTGMCPTGWYCDESASGGPACSWLPQCAQKSSCSCVASALGSACKCVEQDGGLHVTCK